MSLKRHPCRRKSNLCGGGVEAHLGRPASEEGLWTWLLAVPGIMLNGMRLLEATRHATRGR